jgi:hypothetical protein
MRSNHCNPHQHRLHYLQCSRRSNQTVGLAQVISIKQAVILFQINAFNGLGDLIKNSFEIGARA